MAQFGGGNKPGGLPGAPGSGAPPGAAPPHPPPPGPWGRGIDLAAATGLLNFAAANSAAGPPVFQAAGAPPGAPGGPPPGLLGAPPGALGAISAAAAAAGQVRQNDAHGFVFAFPRHMQLNCGSGRPASGSTKRATARPSCRRPGDSILRLSLFLYIWPRFTTIDIPISVLYDTATATTTTYILLFPFPISTTIISILTLVAAGTDSEDRPR